MQFTSAIDFAYKAPEGWLQYVTLDDYHNLGERQKYYKPLYAKYRTVKRRSYDIDTGQFCGWEPHQVGIGDPTGYEYVGYFESRMIDQVLESNVLMNRVLNKPDKWRR